MSTRLDAPRPPAAFTTAWLGARLQRLLGPLTRRRLCVAFSGGLDSTVLLAALLPLRARARVSLRALHVNHHLQPNANLWARAARVQARRLRVPFELLHVHLALPRGASIEAEARSARYQALTARLEADEVLLTAHHLDDQLETVLLALLRGSGLAGLAAMPELSRCGAAWLARPLLPIARAQLRAYAEAHALSWCEDDSNRNERFDRNYLRHRIVPALRERWPAVAATGSRSAAHLAQAQRLLQQGARLQLSAALDGRTLRASVLRRLGTEVRAQVLRLWLADLGLPMPDQRRLQELAAPLLAARADASPCVRWPGAEVRRFEDRLFARAEEARARPCSLRWAWRRRRWQALADGSTIGLVADAHGNVRLDALPAQLTLEFRRGGERLPTARGRVALKELLRAERIAPWRRAAVPLVLDGERVVAVADLWLDAQYAWQGSGERGRFRWRPLDD
jgi:tRNA(Ile)-lysidine synthase